MQSIKADNLEKSFGAVRAVQKYSVEINQGEVVALVGDNGAGKSTVVKMLSGLYKPDAGEIFVNDRSVSLKSALDARKVGIESVLQDLALVPQRPVYLNIFLGREATKPAIRLLDHKLMCREAEKLFLELGVNIPNVKLPIGSLSGGQRQSVAIARAARWSQSLVIMDEPTAALGIAETAKVEELIRNLSSRGTSIFLVSHNLDQVFRLTSKISILRRGEYIGEYQTSQVTRNDIVSKITGSSD